MRRRFRLSAVEFFAGFACLHRVASIQKMEPRMLGESMAARCGPIGS
jgi:hypothetical protein